MWGFNLKSVIVTFIYYVASFFIFGIFDMYLLILILGNIFMKWTLTNFPCGQQPRYVDPLNLTAMACPALPLCPLAITEAERGIPNILKRVRAVFDKVNHKSTLIHLPVTAWKNTCYEKFGDWAEQKYTGIRHLISPHHWLELEKVDTLLFQVGLSTMSLWW